MQSSDHIKKMHLALFRAFSNATKERKSMSVFIALKWSIFEVETCFLHENGIEFHQNLIGTGIRGQMATKLAIWRHF